MKTLQTIILLVILTTSSIVNANLERTADVRPVRD